MWTKVLIFQGANPIFDVGSLSYLLYVDNDDIPEIVFGAMFDYTVAIYSNGKYIENDQLSGYMSFSCTERQNKIYMASYHGNMTGIESVCIYSIINGKLVCTAEGGAYWLYGTGGEEGDIVMYEINGTDVTEEEYNATFWNAETTELYEYTYEELLSALGI